jgi:hypothetical protein
MDEGEQPLAAAYWVGETHLTFEVNNRRVETLTPFSPHEWTHMAFNWKASDGQAEIYINAQLAASGTLAVRFFARHLMRWRLFVNVFYYSIYRHQLYRNQGSISADLIPKAGTRECMASWTKWLFSTRPWMQPRSNP